MNDRSEDLIIISDENERQTPTRKHSIHTRSSSSSSSTLPLKEGRLHASQMNPTSAVDSTTTSSARRSRRTHSKLASASSAEPLSSSSTTTTTTTTSSTTSPTIDNGVDQKRESRTSELYPTNKTRSKRGAAEEKSLSRKRPHHDERPTVSNKNRIFISLVFFFFFLS